MFDPLDPESPLPYEPAPAAPPPRRWRAVLAGGVAGGVLAAAVAVPTTLWLERSHVAPAAESPSAGRAAPETPQQQVPQQEPQDGLFPDTGPQVSTDPRSSGVEASADQSAGVVLIDTVLPNGAGAGTGMVLSADGLILTNYHVVDGSTSVKVTVATTGETYPADVVGYDASADVALLRIEASGLTPVTPDTDGTTTDEAVTAVGNGSGQGYLSAVSGTIEAEDQSITASDGSGNAAGSEDLTGLLQTDAAVVPGYSGGPLLDAEGEVVGITTAASSNGNNMAAIAASESYAVPIDDALTVVKQIEAGDESGPVTIGPAAYLGIGIGDARGTRLAEVAPGGPAATAGLAAGDTITSLDDTEISSYDALVTALGHHEPGDQVRVHWTDATGRSQSATVTLGSSPTN